MRNWIVLSLILALAAGCASVPGTATPTLNPNPAFSGNLDEQIQRVLIGTWNGYVKDNVWSRIDYRDRTLIIYKILKEQNGWTVSAILNGESLEYINLYVHNNTIVLEALDHYGGFYSLTLYQHTHLLGGVDYGRRTLGLGVFYAHEVILEKVPR